MTDSDDGIIELTDIANKDSDLSTGEDVIELTDIVKDEITNFDIDLEISDFKDAEQIDAEFTDDIFEYDDEQVDDELEDNAADIIADEPETEPDSGKVKPGLDKVVPDNFNIDQEQIETILERIIEKKFAGKIESILFEVMEKVIEKQIVEIKESLQKDLE